MNGKDRPLWEWVVFVAVLVFVVGLLGAGYNYQQKLDKQKSLHYQLQVLRTAELLYKSVNKSNPANIQQLIEGTFRLTPDDKARPFLEHPPKLTGGKLLDPFGNPYEYNPGNGWLRSSTPGYEFW